MSWGKKQYEEVYNRADNRHEEWEEYEEYVDRYVDYYDYWRDNHDYDDQALTMKEITRGRLFSVLSKLRIRGAKAILDELWW